MPDEYVEDWRVAAMDKVGVEGAIFISAFSMYRYDASYAVEVQRAHSGRFALVKPVDPDNPAVGEVIAEWKKTPGAVGIRIMIPKEFGRQPGDPAGSRHRQRPGLAGRHGHPAGTARTRGSGRADPGSTRTGRCSGTRSGPSGA